jgi:hypothetical protein
MSGQAAEAWASALHERQLLPLQLLRIECRRV